MNIQQMKRLLIYISLPALFLSCNRFVEAGEAGDTDIPGIPDIPLEAHQILCRIPSTKTALGADLKVCWNEDDSIEVFCGQTSVTCRFASYPF